MTDESQIIDVLSGLKKTASAGFALALHVRFTSPMILLQTYPKAWTDYYSQNGLVMSDPTVAWAFENLGTCRWSDLDDRDPAGVMAQAAAHGLRYGVTCAVGDDESRSMCSFARNDREGTEAEMEAFHADVRLLHHLTTDLGSLSQETLNRLREMSVRLTQPA